MNIVVLIVGIMICLGFKIFFKILYRRLGKNFPESKSIDLVDKDYFMERIRIIGEERNELLEEIEWKKV